MKKLRASNPNLKYILPSILFSILFIFTALNPIITYCQKYKVFKVLTHFWVWELGFIKRFVSDASK